MQMTRDEALGCLRVMARAFRNRADPNADELGNEIDRCADALEAPAKDDWDAEERRAWDMYAAGLLATCVNRSIVFDKPLAQIADAMLTERRARFPKGPDQ